MNALAEPMSDRLPFITLIRIFLLQTSPIPYNNVVVFFDAGCPYIDLTLRVINAEFGLPIKMYTFKERTILPAAQQHEEPNNLVVFAIRNADEMMKIKSIQNALFHNDNHVVLMMSTDDQDRQLIDNIRRNMFTLREFVILCVNGDLWLYRRIHTEIILNYQLDFSQPESVAGTLQSMYNWLPQDLLRWNATIFVHYFPPYGVPIPIFDSSGKYIATEMAGVDTLMAYDIADRLNADSQLVTDLATVVPGYDVEFINPGLMASKMYTVKFHDRIALRRTPVDYNWT